MNLRSSLIRTIVIILVLTSLLVTTFPSSTLAATGTTTTSTLSLTPTFECIGVIVRYTEDDNQNNSATLQYRVTGTASWINAHPMYADRTNSEYRGSIFFLAENTSYDIRVTFSDNDGVTGTNPINDTCTTRNSAIAGAGTTYYVNGSLGNDENDGTDPTTNSWKTIQHAADSVSAGDTVEIVAGTYNEMVTIGVSGTLAQPIKFTNYSGGVVIVDGEFTLGHGFYINNHDYIIIDGLTLRNGVWTGVELRTTDGCIIRNCTIEDPMAYGVRYDYGANNNLIENNVISCNLGAGNAVYATYHWQGGNANVIRNNVFTTTTGALRDGFGGGPEDSPGYNNDFDFYNNDIINCADDGFQIEGSAINCRAWGNTVINSFRAIAFAPCLNGPMYIFRNVVVTTTAAGSMTKNGDNSNGRVYFYHNSFYASNGVDACGMQQTNAGVNNYVVKNNIFRCDYWYVYELRVGDNVDFDYNLLYTTSETRFVEWLNGAHYLTLASFTLETGQEVHGIEGEATFVDGENWDLHLQSGSDGIDAGVILVGFNDESSPWPYSGSAPDMGTYEYGSGGPTNRPPVLSPIGNKSVNIGQQLQFTIFAIDPDGDLLTYSASNLPQGATFNPQTKTCSWTPTSGQAGSYPNVRFTVSDGTLIDYEYITITVLSGDENGAPLLNTIGNKSVNEGTLLQFTISATDPDSDPLTFSADNLPTGATFNPTTKTFSWTPIAGQAGTYANVHFEVSDGELTASEDITITVSALPVQPSLPLRVNAGGNKYIDSQSNTWQADQVYVSGSWGSYGTDNTIDRGTAYAISGTVDDRIYQTLRYDLDGYRFDIANSTYTVTLHFAETWFTSPNERVFDVSIEGQSVIKNLDIFSEAGYSTALTKTFTNVIVTDGQLNVVFDSSVDLPQINGIEILLAGGNHAPVLSAIGNKSATEGTLLQFTISATDSDGDTLTYSASNLPIGAAFNPTTRTFSWTPTSSQVGSYPNVRFTVSDGTLTDYENITITVLSADNSAPVLEDIGNKSVREGEELEFVISATDSDDDILTFSTPNLPQGASFNPATRTFSWTPSLGQRGSYSYIRFRVTDGVLSDTEYITFTVTPNDPPVLASISSHAVREGVALEFTVSATDADDDPLTFSADNLPDGTSFDVETGEFSWTPNSTQIGSYENVHFEVSDGTFTDSEDITITVLSIGNNAPVLDTIGDKSVNETEPLEFTVSATDPDDDPLTFSADNLPDGASFNVETGVFSWTPALGQADTYPAVHFEVSDGELTDSEDITITVNIPTPPGGGGGGDVGDDNPGGGGGGDVGGDSVTSSEEPDETPPVIQEVEIYDVGTDSAVIRWTTTEPGTSQVEYWASPSQFSPLDETLVTEHVVYLTGLNPGTAYHYRTISQDGAGNLVTSPEYDFTTPGKPAAFTVSWLTISPAEANIGQEVTISALITNTGDATGSHDVILSIDGVVQATESIIDLAGGASQEVAFNIVRESAGVYTVNVNGTTGIIVVSGAGESELAISLFGITPNCESDTGVITFARIDYGINESYYLTLFSQLDTELILKAGLGDEPPEEVTLIASGQSEPDMSTGSLNYIPTGGWTSGTYTFQAELRTGEGVIEISPPVRLIITPAAAAGVASWATLGEIIGGVLIIALLAILLILHRNRDMLRTQSLE